MTKHQKYVNKPQTRQYNSFTVFSFAVCVNCFFILYYLVMSFVVTQKRKKHYLTVNQMHLKKEEKDVRAQLQYVIKKVIVTCGLKLKLRYCDKNVK